MRKTYLKVGGYTPENDGREAVIDREYCPRCEKIFDMAGEPCACPVCGWRPGELGGGNGDSEG